MKDETWTYVVLLYILTLVKFVRSMNVKYRRDQPQDIKDFVECYVIIILYTIYHPIYI